MKRAAIVWFLLLWSGLVWGAADTAEYEKPDPTRNVMDLVKAAVQRLDDINVIQKKAIEDMMVLQNQAINDKLSMFMQNSKDLSAAEKSRVDAIRAVDVSAAQTDREKATTQAQVLAEQVRVSNENMRLLVANVSDSTTKQINVVSSELSKRIAELERYQSLAAGSSGGTKDLWGIVFGVVMLLIAIAAFIVPKLKAEPNGRSKQE